MTTFLSILGALVVAILAIGATFLLGMRAKFAPVVNTVRQVNKRVFNPMQMKDAGEPGAYAGVIEHVGRNSGTPYETPVGFCPIDDGFLIVLPYGTSPDWLKNVRAAGNATVRYEGATYDVDSPEVVAAESVIDQLPDSDKGLLSTFNVDEVLRLHAVPNPKT